MNFEGQTEDLKDMFDQENNLILKVLFENRHILQDDLNEEVKPLLQHRWEVLSRKLELHGLKYSWSELRQKVKYWIKKGLLDSENLQKVHATNGDEVNHNRALSESESDDDESVDDYFRLISNSSTSEFQNLPHTSTPKNASKRTTNFVCNVTISPLNSITRGRQLMLENKEEDQFCNKLVQTSMANIVEENTAAPMVYYIDPNTCELKPVDEENEVLLLEKLAEQDERETKRRKLEMTIFEKSVYEQQKKLYKQKMEQRAKEHAMKMKLLERQLKSEEESHQLNMEIAKLRRELLTRKCNDRDSESI